MTTQELACRLGIDLDKNPTPTLKRSTGGEHDAIREIFSIQRDLGAIGPNRYWRGWYDAQEWSVWAGTPFDYLFAIVRVNVVDIL